METKQTNSYVKWSTDGVTSETYVIDDVTRTVTNEIDSGFWLTNSSNGFISNKTVTTMVRDEALAKAELGTLSSIFVLTVLGNSCVLLALALRGIKMTRMYYYLLHLCIADLVTAFFNVLPQLAWDATYRFKGGDFMCKSVKFLQILGPYSSSYVLVVTAVDRYQAICFPLSNCHWTPKRSKIMIASAWVVSLLCCCPQLAIFSYQLVPGSSPEVEDCWGTFIQPWGERAYVTWYAISVFFLPLVVLTFTYVGICRAIWVNVQLKRKSSCVPEKMKKDIKKLKGKSTFLVIGRSYRFRNKEQVEITLQECEIGSDENNGEAFVDQQKATRSKQSSSSFKVNSDNLVAPRTHSMRGLSRAKIKTVKITVVVIMGYILCSTPFICVQLWAYWWPGAQQSSFWSGPVITILMLLSSLNSCLNPWIYLCFNPNLLAALRNFCCCRRDAVKGKHDTVMSTNTEFHSVHSHAVNENRLIVKNSEPRSTPSLTRLRANSQTNQVNNCLLLPLKETTDSRSIVSENEVSDETNA